MVAIKCPKTGKTISTGMDMDQASLDSSNMSDNAIRCPECGDMHTWNKKDAFIV